MCTLCTPIARRQTTVAIFVKSSEEDLELAFPMERNATLYSEKSGGS